MSERRTLTLITALAFSGMANAQPVRKFDDAGAPPFKVLKEEENPPLDAYDNFVIGPNYTPAPERKKVDGVPEGKVQQFQIDSKETKLFNPGITRGNTRQKIDPNNPKTVLVETSKVDYKRNVGVYVPAQYKEGTEAPFMVVHDGPGQANGYKTILDNLIHQKRIPPIVLVSIQNGGGDAQGNERGKEYDNMNGDYATYIEDEVLPRVEKNCHVKLTKDPNGRAVMGCSSGGSCALIMAWFRNDLYHRVLTTSGTFVNQAWPFDPKYPDGAWGFHEKLIPKEPKKPIRIFIQVGDKDLFNPNVMRDDMHDWVAANHHMAKVLKEKGYEYQYLFCRGAGHCDGKAQAQFIPHAIEWVWKGYPGTKVK
jgi:enterochelin esterase-like enzyme